MPGQKTTTATTWTFDRIPDLAGKTFIVTGGNTGLGRVTARELARKNAVVIIASRSEEKTLPIVQAIQSETKNPSVHYMHLDLLSLKSVDAFATQFMATHPALHGLVLNAGIMMSPFALSRDGIETQFATNHVAHFHLTNRLLPWLERTAAKDGEARVVSLSSLLHDKAPAPEGIRFDKINDKASYNPTTAYGQSKLANILFAKQLAADLEARGVENVYVNSVHPGIIQTELSRHIASNVVMKFMVGVYYRVNPNIISQDEGASTSLYLATDPEIVEKKYKGEYFVPIAKLAKPTIPQVLDKYRSAQILFSYRGQGRLGQVANT
ncbi:hypothetical protein DFJ73DRAFT_30954 [Zopfochytrium polystomum]|nr:hypothetical protein DFJ73DRAFT_30954 [Zopfochytrium polystomum]